MKAAHIRNGLLTLGGAVLAGLIVEWTKGFPVLRFLGRAARELWNWLRSPLMVERWFLYLALVGASLLLIGTVARRVSRRAPKWLKYRKARFLELDWRWEYFGSEIAPGTVTPYCPKCLCQMVFEDVNLTSAKPFTMVNCTECDFGIGFDGWASNLRERIARLAEREITTGDWTRRLSPSRGDARPDGTN